jgi:hypothetical protein
MHEKARCYAQMHWGYFIDKKVASVGFESAVNKVKEKLATPAN